MPNKFIFLSLILILSLIKSPAALAQSGSGTDSSYPEGARPDIPGMLGIEFGFMLIPNFPDEMKTNFLGTNMFTAYYKYDINIGESRFSVHPGLAVSAQKYSFKENVLVASINPGTGFETTLLGLDSIVDGGVKKSLMKTAYFEIPLELTFRTNQQLPKRSFKFTVGVRGGVLIDSKTKYKYSQDGQNKITKQKERLELNQFSALLIGRVGYSSFNIFYTYNLLPVFESDKGPRGTNAQTMSFGIALDLF